MLDRFGRHPVHRVRIDLSQDGIQHPGHAERLLRFHLGDRFLEKDMMGMEH